MILRFCSIIFDVLVIYTGYGRLPLYDCYPCSKVVLEKLKNISFADF